jgi:hypothetical protein
VKGKAKEAKPKRQIPYPIPEALPGTRGKDWIIKETFADGHGTTQFDPNEMAVPLDEDPRSAVTRIHEMAHAAWSESDPATLTKKWGLKDKTLTCVVEDLRMNTGLKNSGITLPMEVVTGSDADYAKAAERIVRMDEKSSADALRAAVHLGVSSIHTGDWAHIDKALKTSKYSGCNEMRGLIQTCVTIMRNHTAHGSQVPGISGTREACRYLEDYIKVIEDAEKAAKSQQGDDDDDTIARKAKVRDVQFNERAERDPQGTLSIPFKIPKTGDGTSIWGDMVIEYPPLDFVAQVRIKARRRKNDECGVDVRALDRMLVDGRVFGCRRRVPGGTVLIDNSGSMGFTAQQVKRIMMLAPAATIAFYEGNGTDGRLVIAAKRGKIMDEAGMRRQWGDNTVDGPALVWLAGQAAPRYWVSDEGVTGRGSRSGASEAHLLAYCRVVCARAYIKRLDSMEEVEAEFKGLTEDA